MKKSLVLAMAMALGVTASAYAANPFSDVPAGHWAYDSISKLAAAGVIEGYGDDTFRGDRLMTRYEMAQIVAKAMAKGANVDKLAAEFADELDALGVRVAALEKKSDNVKITGQVRWRWALGSKARDNDQGKRRNHDLRSRLWFNGQINSGWKYVGMLENIQYFRDDVGNEATDFQRAYVTGRLGGVKVEAGRNNVNLIGGDSDVYMNRADQLKLTYGDKFKISGWYGKPTAMGRVQDALGNVITRVDRSGAAMQNANNSFSKFGGIRLSYDWDKWGLFAEYDKFSQKNRLAAGAQGNPRDIFGIGVNAKFGDFGLKAIYLHGNIKNLQANQPNKKNGYTIALNYKGAKANKVGSWGAELKYYDQGNATYINGLHGLAAIEGAFFPGNTPAEGFRAFRIGANYTVAKNMIAKINYISMKAKGPDNAPNKNKSNTIYTQLIMTF